MPTFAFPPRTPRSTCCSFELTQPFQKNCHEGEWYFWSFPRLCCGGPQCMTALLWTVRLWEYQNFFCLWWLHDYVCQQKQERGQRVPLMQRPSTSNFGLRPWMVVWTTLLQRVNFFFWALALYAFGVFFSQGAYFWNQEAKMAQGFEMKRSKGRRIMVVSKLKCWRESEMRHVRARKCMNNWRSDGGGDVYWRGRHSCRQECAISHFWQTSIWVGIGKEMGYKGMIKDWAVRHMKGLDEKQVLKLLI